MESNETKTAHRTSGNKRGRNEGEVGDSQNNGSASQTSPRGNAGRANLQKGEQRFSRLLQPTEIGEQLLAQLPKRLQKDIEILMDESDRTLSGARDYVRENPREALGIVVGLSAFAWGLFGTGPGRKAAMWGATIAMPYVTGWIGERFDRGASSTTGDLSENRSESADETLAGNLTASPAEDRPEVAH